MPNAPAYHRLTFIASLLAVWYAVGPRAYSGEMNDPTGTPAQRVAEEINATESSEKRDDVRAPNGIVPIRQSATGTVRHLAPYSPFLPAGPISKGARFTPAENETLELRGIMSGPDGDFFCIFDSKKKSGTWVRLRETGFPFVISSADVEREEVHLPTSGGQDIVLRLGEAKVNE